MALWKPTQVPSMSFTLPTIPIRMPETAGYMLRNYALSLVMNFSYWTAFPKIDAVVKAVKVRSSESGTPSEMNCWLTYMDS